MNEGHEVPVHARSGLFIDKLEADLAEGSEPGQDVWDAVGEMV